MFLRYNRYNRVKTLCLLLFVFCFSILSSGLFVLCIKPGSKIKMQLMFERCSMEKSTSEQEHHACPCSNSNKSNHSQQQNENAQSLQHKQLCICSHIALEQENSILPLNTKTFISECQITDYNNFIDTVLINNTHITTYGRAPPFLYNNILIQMRTVVILT
jgi:hypothetical protein